jgi:hypothetical protein
MKSDGLTLDIENASISFHPGANTWAYNRGELRD